MKSVLIVENSMNSLNISESNNKEDQFVLGGIFTEFDVKNRNERVYTADRFLPCLQELNERIESMGVVYGEFDHPDVFDTSLSRASHIVTKAHYVKENNRVEGEIRLLNTHWGKEAKALVGDNCPIFVSSRAAGITESDGTVTLKKLFTYDIVADPGFASANNDLVTKQQLTDYSQYLVNELASTKKEVRNAIKKGNLNPKKLEQLLEYYENLNETNSQILKYLDYLAEKVQIVVNENTDLKNTADRLIKHSDYLAENLEKAINYTEYVAENLDKNIEYSEYIAENLDKNISYAEYIAENLDKNISYAEYLAENLDKNIAYSEYLAENLDKNIAYSEYIAENLDKNISYAEYLAENLDNSIAYSEYLAEHVEGNIAYSEYIAENLDDNIAYSDYIAENLDKSISYQSLIVEKLNGGKLFESNEEEERLPLLNVVGINSYEEEEEEEGDKYGEGENWNDSAESPTSEETPQVGESNDTEEHLVVAESNEAEETQSEAEETQSETETQSESEETQSEAEETTGETEEKRYEGNSDSELSQSIDKLIEEAKKRKATETSDLHFLTFLTKSQVDSYYSLTNEEQDAVKLYISEKSFFTQVDVLRLISEALTAKNESLEERVIRLMPENIKPIWNQLNENARKSILSQARLYPSEVMATDSQVDHFWMTRNLKKNESVTKKLVSHESMIQEDELGAIMERFKNL